MKLLKSFLSLLFSIALIGSLIFGCSSSNNEETVNEEKQAEQEKKKEEKKKEKKENNLKKKYEGTLLKDSITELRDSGYTLTYSYAKTGYDCTSEYESLDANDEYLDGWIVKALIFKDDTMNIAIQTQESYDEDNAKAEQTEQTESLLDNLDLASAWNAAEDYGKIQYPYGFTLHYMTGKLAQELYDENTLYLKAYCTVENAYGNKMDATCEAYVTGTSESPQVVDFIVY